MIVPDNQKIAIFWNDKPIGLVTNYLHKPSLLKGKITTVVWRGECLGEPIADGSPSEVYRRARMIAKEKGLRHIWIGDGSDVDTLYTPAFED